MASLHVLPSLDTTSLLRLSLADYSDLIIDCSVSLAISQHVESLLTCYPC